MSDNSNDSEFLREIVRELNPENHLFITTEDDGDLMFDYIYQSEQGQVGLRFNPHGFVSWANKKSEEILLGAFGLDSAEQFPADFTRQFSRMIIASFLQGISGKTQSLLNELDSEVTLFIRGILHSFPEMDELVGEVDLHKEIERLAKDMVSERKQFLRSSLAHFSHLGRPLMKGYYESLLPIWQEARTVYRANRKFPTWQRMVDVAFESHSLPKELVALISGKPDDLLTLPEDLRKRAEDAWGSGEDYSKPSNLALEHAARLSGYRPFQHGPRMLRRHMDAAVAVAGVKSEPSKKQRKRR